MTMTVNKRASALTLVLGMAVLFPGATQQAAADEAEVRVRYTQDELNDTAGIEEVHARVLKAASRSCRQPGLRGLDRLRREQACTVEAVERLLATIGSERLDALHAARRVQAGADAG